MALLANIIVAFVPVLVFLAVLVMMDSFKLARPSAIATAMGWGVVAAVLSGISQFWMTGTLSESAFHRVAAPAIEENRLEYGTATPENGVVNLTQTLR